MATTSAATPVPDELWGAAVSPHDELLAYEYLYSKEGSSLKAMAQATVKAGRLPTDAMREEYGILGPGEDYAEVSEYVDSKLGACSFAVNGTYSWPSKLADSDHPLPILYYRGDIGLLDGHTPSVSVVGARKATEAGLSRAWTVARQLSQHGVTIVTGLARGIDTAALRAAIKTGGRAVGVIGTPVDEYYPRENRDLQDWVAQNGLLLSQVPFYRYKVQHFKSKSRYFPERNELMAAVSDATVIVEASDTSGTLSQARACMAQGRPLFVMRSCAEDPSVTWPARFVGKPGVTVLDDVSQVLDAVGAR